jgi:hypothetical protein
MRTGTHVTRRLLCICEASAYLVLSDETCVVLGTVAVPEVNRWHWQVVEVLAEVDLCRKHNTFTPNTAKPH